MSGSLLSAATGLKVHQQMLDVVGNNLANINTPGYKSSRTVFSDLISRTIKPSTRPNDAVGGTNPQQVGLGVQVASIGTNMAQGSLQRTGRNLDAAIQGEGFFAVNDGKRDLYTRVGAFDLDRDNFLVDSGTGFRVQNASGADIQIDVDAGLPAKKTDIVTFTGNLDAGATGPLQALVSTASPLTEGTVPSVTSTNAEPFALADGMKLDVKVDGGRPQTVTFQTAQFADISNATVAEVVAAISAQVSDAVVSDVGGAVRIASLNAGLRASVDIDDGSGSPASLLGISTQLVAGTETPADATTSLNLIPGNTVDYVAGDRIDIAGIDADGSDVGDSFIFGTGPGQHGTTVGDLVAFIDSRFPESKASLRADGTIELEALETGAVSLSLSLSNGPLNTGSTVFSSHAFVEERAGSDGDRFDTAIEVFDSQGRAHTMGFEFHKLGANEWEVTASLPSDDGAFTDAFALRVLFNNDGSFNRVGGAGAADGDIEVLFDGLDVLQSVKLDFGTSGAFGGLTQFGGQTSAAATSQDGFEAGALGELALESDGTIIGIYTNGQIVGLEQLQIATFANPAGLQKVGSNLLAVTSNSGEAIAGRALTGRAGQVVSSVLEGSNVDIAEEFTRLIVAQRGFQVNARTITTTDQVLQELSNIIR